MRRDHVEPRGFKLPRDGEPRPSRLIGVGRIDTGGAWRAAHRPQDPGTDPREPGGGESSSAGTDHGWANCTMAAGATAYAYEAHYAGRDAAPWGGDMRHSGQPDLSGGTDLYDLRDAWELWGGYSLRIRSGAGWSAVVDEHDVGAAIVIQGEGDCPGSGDFTGGHACAIGPETRSNGDWLWSDPVCSGWQWVSPASIRAWAERLTSSIAFGASRPAPTTNGGDDVGVALNLTEPYDGTAEVIGTGHSYIRIYDGAQYPVQPGWIKDVFARAKLRDPFTTDGGGVIAAGTPVVIIGETEAVLLEADVLLTPASSGTAVRDRDALWVDRLTEAWPVGVEIVDSEG